MIASCRTPVFVTSPTWQMNGVNIFAMNLNRGLAARGYIASIVLTDPLRSESIPLSRPSDLRFEELPVGPMDTVFKRWKELIRFLERNSPCIYIPNYDWHTSCVAPRLGGDIGIIGVVHSDDPRHYEHFDRMAATWNAVVAVSRTVGQRIAARNPRIADRLSVIPIGVDLPDERQNRSAGGGPLRILYAGLLKQHQKRVFDVPEIIRETIHRGTSLTLSFAGGGDDESALKDACRDLESRGAVRFLGILDREQLAEEFDRHDVLLMTSEFEGLPNVLLEAMAHSLVPVVSAVASGIPEVIRDGENGLIAPIGDIHSFADLIEKLARDRDLLFKMAAAARASIENGPFRVDRMVEAYTGVIDRVGYEAENGTFARPRGRIIPPPDLNLSWRHRVPSPVRTLWRRIRRIPANG